LAVGEAEYHAKRLFVRCTRTLAVAAFAAVMAVSTDAYAETRIAGEPDLLTMETDGDTVQRILDALGARFEVRVRSSVPLNERIVGSYSGPVERVVAALLEKYNYYAKSDDGRYEVAVLGLRQIVPTSARAGTNPPKLASGTNLPQLALPPGINLPQLTLPPATNLQKPAAPQTTNLPQLTVPSLPPLPQPAAVPRETANQHTDPPIPVPVPAPGIPREMPVSMVSEAGKPI
jgi:hypothetical protein